MTDFNSRPLPKPVQTEDGKFFERLTPEEQTATFLHSDPPSRGERELSDEEIEWLYNRTNPFREKEDRGVTEN